MNLKNLFHINSENLAVPEIHSDSFEEKQKKADAEENEELEKKDINRRRRMRRRMRSWRRRT